MCPNFLALSFGRAVFPPLSLFYVLLELELIKQ